MRIQKILNDYDLILAHTGISDAISELTIFIRD